MSECPRPVRVCGSQTLAEGAEASCPDWEVCLPFGARLYQTDGCVRYEPGAPPEDGVYGLITIENGCITAVEEADVAVYQSDSCAPVPCSCSEDDGSSSSSSDLCDASTTTGNLYSCDSLGKPLVKAYINGGDNVSVTGYGTRTSPFVISVDTSNTGVTSIFSTTDAITVTSSTGDIEIAHKTGWNEQNINGMVFDSYGHLIDYDDSSASTDIVGIVGQNGVSATTASTGIVTIELADPANVMDGSYMFGAYEVTLDAKNRIYNMTREISGTAGTYTFGSYDVEVNAYGSIVSITENTSTTQYSALVSGSSSATQLSMDFDLSSPSYLMVEVQSASTDSEWSEGLDVLLDGSTVGDKVSLAGTLIAAPGGVYTQGTHTLQLVNKAGFTDNNFNVTVRPVSKFTSAQMS